MIETNVIAAGCALALAVTAGLVVHEWSHALALRLAGVEYTIEYFPDRTSGVIGALASCPWAQVCPRPTGREPPLVLRLAALMPVTLVLPIFVLGAIPPLPTDHAVMTAIVVGWLACAIPSPQDFSVAFYAHRVLEQIESDDPASALPWRA